MNNPCTCGMKFRDAEDFRDHVPCPGKPEFQEIERLRAEVTKLRLGIRFIEQNALKTTDSRDIAEYARNLLNGVPIYG